MPTLVKMGERARSAKRGAHGPAPARKNTLWDRSAARKGALVVTDARTGELLSSKDATQEQLGRYATLRQVNLVAEALRRGINPDNAAGRRWLARAAVRGETWLRQSPERMFRFAPAKFTPVECAPRTEFVRVSPIR